MRFLNQMRRLEPIALPVWRVAVVVLLAFLSLQILIAIRELRAIRNEVADVEGRMEQGKRSPFSTY